MALLSLFIGTLSSSVGMNLLLQMTGIVAATAGEAAANQTTNALTGYGLVVSILLYGIATPFVEELVFRGMFYSGLYSMIAARKMGPTDSLTNADVTESNADLSAKGAPLGATAACKERLRIFLLAAGISSLVFGIYHMNLAQGIYAFVMGMTFCLAYELTGQFLSPWILHAACNIIALLLSQSVNGTNAFTQLCTWPWTGCFLAIAVMSYILLHRILSQPGT